MALNANNFVPLSVLSPSAPSRLVASSCSPEKDLTLIISRQANKDKLSLWKLQGSKKWQVEVSKWETGTTEEIIDLTWSPDGQTIAVAHHPPRISLHSVHDGREQRSWDIQPPHSPSPPNHRLTNITWIANTKPEDPETEKYPDFFQRGKNKPGSAHSLLKSLPLLGPYADESQPQRAANLFAFQLGVKPIPRSYLPGPTIANWPSLPQDLLAASIASPPEPGLNQADTKDEPDDADFDTLITVADNMSSIHVFLDGTFPLGSVLLSPGGNVVSVIRIPGQSCLLATAIVGTEQIVTAMPVSIPLLYDERTRNMARTSTSIRDLMWLVIRVLEGMRKSWFGADGHEGARDYGPKWLRLLEDRQRSHVGDMEPHGIFELTLLLTTGRASEALGDLLAGGGKLSERGLNTWRTSVTETLIKLRDEAEKTVVPVLQRIIILLEEVLGWTQLRKKYSTFEFHHSEVAHCLLMAHRGISSATWLADAARKELEHFTQFMTWLAWEAHRATTPEAAHATLTLDIFAINEYLKSGLRASHLDKWFMGPIPWETPENLRSVPVNAPSSPRSFRTIINEARKALEERPQPKNYPLHWAPPRSENLEQPHISHLDRNLIGLVSDLASRFQLMFSRSSGAPGRSALIKGHWPLLWIGDNNTIIRELLFSESVDEHVSLYQYSAILIPQEGDEIAKLLLICVRFPVSGAGDGASDLGPPPSIDCVVLDCCLPTETEISTTSNLDVLDVQFFDQQYLTLVVRTRETDGSVGRAYLLTVAYRDLPFETMEQDTDVTDTLQSLAAKLSSASVSLPIARARQLTLCREPDAPVILAVNGKRKVACVLDGRRSQIEVFDLDAEEGEDGEDEEMADQ